jgi:hypothetical protein
MHVSGELSQQRHLIQDGPDLLARVIADHGPIQDLADVTTMHLPVYPPATSPLSRSIPSHRPPAPCCAPGRIKVG